MVSSPPTLLPSGHRTLTMKLRIWATMGGGVKILPKIVTGFPSNLEVGVARRVVVEV